MKQCRPDF